MSDGVIGSVAVSVTPDARGFWVDFEQQTRAGAAEAGRRSGEQWRREFDNAAGPARVRVDLDTAQARAQLQQLSQQGQSSSGSLLKSLIPLAPALVPVAGAAAAAAGALAGMGVAGILAVKGIKSEMAAGTPVGKQFAASIAEAKTSLGVLETTAAGGVLNGFGASVAKLSAQLPEFNNFVADSSKNLGAIGSNLTGALISGFTTFAPVISEVEGEFVKLSAAFQKFAAGPAGAKFAQTLADDFKQVVPVVESLAVNAGHLVAAFAPVGGTVLTEIGLLSHAIEGIPIPVLQAAATAFIAFRTATAVSTGITSASVALTRLGRSAAGLGGIGTGLGVVASGLARVAPAAAGFVAFGFAADAAAKATTGWATSASDAKYVIFETSRALNDLTHLHLGDFYSDLAGGRGDQADKARKQLLTLKDAIDTVAKSKFVDVTIAPGYSKEVVSLASGLGLAQKQAAAYATTIAGVTRAQGVFTAQIAHTPLSELSGVYTQQASAIDKTSQSLSKYLTAGTEVGFVYRGVKVGVDAFSEALAASGGSTRKAEALLRGQINALMTMDGQQKLSAASALKLSTVVADAEGKYKLTADQVDLYAEALGITGQQLVNGTVTTGLFLDRIGSLDREMSSAGPSVLGFVSAIDAFNKAGDTAASRSTLIGQALVSLQGDALGYANTMVSAATANQQLVTDFRNTAKGVIDLKTGFIDYHNAGAAPVLNDLQQLQTAAMNAAAATYQHEVATVGSGQAAKDAAAVFKNDTYGALVQQATQLGITGKQAKTLADQLFHWPKNATTLIKQLGGDSVNSVLSKILAALVAISHGASFNINTYEAEQAILHLRQSIANLPGALGVNGAGLITAAGGSGAAAGHYAAGGRVGDGYFTVGERGWELGYKRGDKVEIVSHAQAMKITGLPSRLPGFASGTGEQGGFTGVTTTGSGGLGKIASASGGTTTTPSSGHASVKIDYIVEGKKYASLRTAENAALAAFRANVHLAATIEGKGFTQWREALAGSVADARAAFSSIRTEARKLSLPSAFLASLSQLEAKTEGIVRDRNRVQAALGDPPNTATTAYDRLADALSKFRDERSSVVDAVKGSFDITSAGANPVTGAISGAGIAADSKQNLNLIKKFVHDATALKGKVNDAYWAQLVGKGPDAEPQVAALLSLPKTALRQINSEQSQAASLAGQLGQTAANQLYGSQLSSARVDVTQLQNRLHTDNTKIAGSVKHMEDRLASKLDDFAHRPVLVTADGKVIARVVNEANNKQAARK